MSDAYRREKLQACVSILRRTRDHVYEKNKAEHGELSLRSQAVFARHDALASAAQQIADENSFLCLPSLHLYLELNTTLEEYEVQANVVRGEITNAQNTEMMLNRERRRHKERGKRREMVARIDFAGVEHNNLLQSSLLKFSVDFRIIGEERGSQNKEHIHSFQMGDVVWVSCAVRGSSKRKGEQLESRPTYLGFVMSPSKIIDDASSTPLRTMEFGIMSVEPDFAERDYKELWTNLRWLLKVIRKKSTHAGSAHMRILASDINILTQMSVFRVSVSQDVLLPVSPSGHFPHVWTEGGPICSKVCHGTVSGPTVDVVRRDAQTHTISLAHTCMLAASGPFWNVNSYFSRKYSSSRRLSRGNSRICPPAHETI